jgi:Uma2 family endonuclease
MLPVFRRTIDLLKPATDLPLIFLWNCASHLFCLSLGPRLKYSAPYTPFAFQSGNPFLIRVFMPTTTSIAHELWTADEFLDWLEPGVFADLIDGEILMHSPVSLLHGNLTNFLDRLLASFIEHQGLGGVVHREVIAVRMSQRSVVMPDIAFYTREQEALFQEMHIPVAPTWVAEILSPTTALNDVGRKFAKYEEYGVKEYWVLDPKALAHRFYSRRDNLLLEFGQNEEIIRSGAIPGFWVKRSWLDRQLRVNPTVAEALAQLVALDK